MTPRLTAHFLLGGVNVRIFINPGHSINDGEDNGARGNGLVEAEVALKISNRVACYLRAIEYTVYVYQNDWLESIVDVANYWDADLFVSIHCNAAPDELAGQIRGTETFYNHYSVEGRLLATAIQRRIVQEIPTVDRGIKTGELFVTKYTDAPAVLVETAFIDNADDARLLVEYEDSFARAIACGITDYFRREVPLPDVFDDY